MLHWADALIYQDQESCSKSGMCSHPSPRMDDFNVMVSLLNCTSCFCGGNFSLVSFRVTLHAAVTPQAGGHENCVLLNAACSRWLLPLSHWRVTHCWLKSLEQHSEMGDSSFFSRQQKSVLFSLFFAGFLGVFYLSWCHFCCSGCQGLACLFLYFW